VQDIEAKLEEMGKRAELYQVGHLCSIWHTCNKSLVTLSSALAYMSSCRMCCIPNSVRQLCNMTHQLSCTSAAGA
jgi:hypothetical protein